MDIPVIDTHVHIWDLSRAEYPWLENDRSVLNKNYCLDELEPDRRKTNVVAGVLVQASGNLEDTKLMLEAAKKTDWIKGVVGWLPLRKPEATERLLETLYEKESYLKGVRHQIHDEPDPEWLLNPAVLTSLRMLADARIPYDVVGVSVSHLKTALKVSEKIPHLRLVLDHLNQPPLGAGLVAGEWAALMKDAVSHPGIFAKISGLGTVKNGLAFRSRWELAAALDFVFAEFGTARCFCGGDWPVSLLAGSYADTWKLYEATLRSLLRPEDLKKVFFDNAKDFYKLELNGNAIREITGT